MAYGYSQVLGIDFSKNYSLVDNDIIFCILLLMVIHFGLSAKITNVETIFLYGDLKEENFIECPQGMSDRGKDDCIILNKWIYGLVQAVRQYYKKTVEILKKSEFIGSIINSCLHANKNNEGEAYIALYVDNNLMVGDSKAIDDAITAIKENGLVLEIVEGLQDYLFFEVKFSAEKRRAWLGQPHLIENLEKSLAVELKYSKS